MKRSVSLIMVLCLALLCVPAMAEQAPAVSDISGTSALSIIPENAPGVLEDRPGTLPLYMIGNPTTGFDWYFAILDDTVISLEAAYEAENTDEMISGAGGLYGFYIKGLKAGDTIVAFDYKQGFDPDTSPYVSLMYFVNVDESLNVTITCATVGFE